MEELVNGRNISLADNSILWVQLVNNQVQVLRNGQLLHPVSIAKEPEVRTSSSNKFFYVLTHPSIATFNDAMRDAEWGSIIGKLFTLLVICALFTFLFLLLTSLQLSSAYQASRYSGASAGIDMGALILAVIVAALIEAIVIPLIFFVSEGIHYGMAYAF